jgi:hypothetical protein
MRPSSPLTGHTVFAQVAELVDAQVSGTCGRKVVEVRVFSWAPFNNRTQSAAPVFVCLCIFMNFYRSFAISNTPGLAVARNFRPD